MTETYQVRDGARIVTFEGELLAEVSSERPTSPRWTELKLYKTDTDKYVLSKIGRSLVLHMPGCPAIVGRLDRFVDVHPGEDPERGSWDMHVCVAIDYDQDELLLEETRFWAVVADTAQDVVNHLQRKEGGVTLLPRMSVNLLEQASENDEAIGNAFYIQKI